MCHLSTCKPEYLLTTGEPGRGAGVCRLSTCWSAYLLTAGQPGRGTGVCPLSTCLFAPQVQVLRCQLSAGLYPQPVVGPVDVGSQQHTDGAESTQLMDLSQGQPCLPLPLPSFSPSTDFSAHSVFFPVSALTRTPHLRGLMPMPRGPMGPSLLFRALLSHRHLSTFCFLSSIRLCVRWTNACVIMGTWLSSQLNIRQRSKCI